MNRKKSIINIIIYFAGTIFFTGIVGYLLDLSNKHIKEFSYFSIVMSLVGLVLFIYNRKFIKEQFKRNYKLKETYRIAGKGFVTLYVVLILNLIFFFKIDPSIGQTPGNEEALNTMFANIPKISLILVAGLLIPLIEELVFRASFVGLIIGDKCSTSYVPYVLCAIFFALLHDASILGNPLNIENIYFFVLYFIPSLVLALYYKKTNHNLLVVYFIHMINNTISVI